MLRIPVEALVERQGRRAFDLRFRDCCPGCDATHDIVRVTENHGGRSKDERIFWTMPMCGECARVRRAFFLPYEWHGSILLVGVLLCVSTASLSVLALTGRPWVAVVVALAVCVISPSMVILLEMRGWIWPLTKRLLYLVHRVREDQKTALAVWPYLCQMEGGAFMLWFKNAAFRRMLDEENRDWAVDDRDWGARGFRRG